MTEQRGSSTHPVELRTPDELAIENALICEKLLGFKRHCDKPGCLDWRIASGQRYWGNPTFTTWADAGLVLDALINLGIGVDVGNSGGGWYCDIYSGLVPSESTGPLAVRAAALQYIRSLP
jgi:hypothetical protein